MAKRDRVYQITKGRCFYCGCAIDKDTYHIDHFVPKSTGGKGGDNLVPSCADCNLSKGNLSIEEFRQKIASYMTASHHGRMICKYFDIEDQPIRFYFERMSNGNLQNCVDVLLDRHQGDG